MTFAEYLAEFQSSGKADLMRRVREALPPLQRNTTAYWKARHELGRCGSDDARRLELLEEIARLKAEETVLFRELKEAREALMAS